MNSSIEVRSKTILILTISSLLMSLGGLAKADYSYNKALKLDGRGDFVQVYSGYVPRMTTPFYVDAWFKTSSQNPDQAIVSQYKAFSNSNLDDVFLLSVHNGKARFQINPGNQYLILDGTRRVNDGHWHHVSAGYDGSTMWLRVDGYTNNEDFKKRSASGFLNHVNNTHLRIGALYDARVAGPGFFFHGEIDEVRIWNGAPTAVEWQQWIPYRQRTQNEPVRLAWRFNGYPDSGYNPSFHGDAHERYALDRPYANPETDSRSNTALAFGVVDPYSYTPDRSYVNVIGGASLNTGNRITIEAIYGNRYCRSNNYRLQSLVSKFKHNSGNINDDGYFLGIESTGLVRFQLSNGSGWRLIRSTTNVDSGIYHHIAGVYDGREMRLYIDGVLESRANFSGTLAGQTTPLLLGASYEGDAHGDFLCGIMDDVRVWDVARSQNQIDANRERLVDTARPLAWWNFEGDFINLSQYRTVVRRYWGQPANKVFFFPAGKFQFY